MARRRKPELPGEKRARYVADFGVTEYDAGVLASDLATARYFETAAAGRKKAEECRQLDSQRSAECAFRRGENDR